MREAPNLKCITARTSTRARSGRKIWSQSAARATTSGIAANAPTSTGSRCRSCAGGDSGVTGPQRRRERASSPEPGVSRGSPVVSSGRSGRTYDFRAAGIRGVVRVLPRARSGGGNGTLTSCAGRVSAPSRKKCVGVRNRVCGSQGSAAVWCSPLQKTGAIARLHPEAVRAKQRRKAGTRRRTCIARITERYLL